jgi:serine/threonine protein kinase
MAESDPTLEDISTSLSEFLVNASDFEPIQTIGKGGFGEVFFAKDRRTGKSVALKRLHAETLVGGECLYYCREVQILATCDNAFLLPIIGFTVTYPFLIITPFVKNGSLFDALGRGGPQLDGTAKTRVAMGIAHGMARLHEIGVIHRDLKSLNILLDEQLYPRICDFGIARYGESGDRMTLNLGTPHWMAPEMYSTVTYTNKVDVYAYGMLLYELLTESVPFRGKKAMQIAMGVVNGERPILHRSTPPGLARLMRRCWSADADERPDFVSIYAEFEAGTVAFSGTVAKEIEAFAKFTEENSGKTHKALLDMDELGSRTLSPQTIRNFADEVNANDSKRFFQDLSAHLTNAAPAKQKTLIELAEHVVLKGRPFAAAFVASGAIERLDWSCVATVEIALRLICRVMSQDTRAFGPPMFLKILEVSDRTSPVPIIYSIAVFLQSFDRSAEHMSVFSAFLAQAPSLVLNDGAESYIQTLSYMFKSFPAQCTQLETEFARAIYQVLLTDHPRAVHDVYRLYTTFPDAGWSMEDAILLRHLELPQTQYALLSYLIRSYTPTSESFVGPLIKISAEYPALVGIVLCRMLSKSHHLAKNFLYNNMRYLQNMHILVSARLLFFIGSDQEVRAVLAQHYSVYTFLAALVSRIHETIRGAAILIGKFGASREVAEMTANSGLLKAMDDLVFGGPFDEATVYAVMEVHSKFDGFVLPSDYDAVIQWLQKKLWPQSALTGLAIATLCGLSNHAEAKKALLDKNILATLNAGDTAQYLENTQVILKNLRPRK